MNKQERKAENAEILCLEILGALALFLWILYA